MLTTLTIKNYALIDELNVSFNNGLTIITGETGAGKSILLGGLSLVLGKRADLSQVKDTSKKCIIEAVFDLNNYNLKALFSSEGLDYETQTIIRREILPSGKSRAFVNDTPVTLDSLAVLSNHLLDIHSQHQTQQLTDDNYQFKVIDALADNKVLLENYIEDLSKHNVLNKELEALLQSKTDAVKEYDYNLFLLKELEDAKLVDGELEALESSYEQLSNVELINEKLNSSKTRLETEDLGIIDKIKEVNRELSQISEFSSDYKVLQERINSVIIELDDINSELDRLEDKLLSDPKELERVSDKLQIINNLLHKHSVTQVPELLEIQNKLSSKVMATETLDATIQETKAALNKLNCDLQETATKIHNNRKKVIPEFINNLENILSELGMPNAKFKIEINKTEHFRTNGMDTLQFLFMANKGSGFTELKKAASGGELSRIMLAIKSILANYIQLPTIMFDEIDTGVSGEISNKMGSIMKSMSKSMQVFTITHLPQIAAKGDSHFKVFKIDKDNMTYTQIKALRHQERIVEIAQMLGGHDVSDSAMAHAKQLLN